MKGVKYMKRKTCVETKETFVLYDNFTGETEARTYSDWLLWFSDYFLGADPEKDLGIRCMRDLIDYINDQESDFRYTMFSMGDNYGVRMSKDWYKKKGILKRLLCSIRKLLKR